MAITKIGTTGISNNLDVPGYLYLSGDNKELRFYNGANYMVLKASGSLSNNYTITLPVDDGTSGQFLKTDGGGVLSWDAAGAALTPWTENIDADTFTLTDVGATGNTWNSTALTVQSTTNAKLRLVIGSGDASIVFEGPTNWVLGLDNSESDQFVIGNDTALGTDDSLRITTAGAVTMPNQPSFIAKLTTSQTNVTGNTILFRSDNAANSQWNIMENRGSGFANGKFTAPVAGLYQFSLIINLEGLTSAMSYYNLVFYTDTPAANISITSENPWTQCYTPSGNLLTRWAMLVEMDANDYAYFGGYVYYGSQVVDLQPSTFFSGYLVA